MNEEELREVFCYCFKADYADYLKAMDKCVEDDNYESSHSEADDLLCAFLIEQGCIELVSKYYDVGKLYA